MTTPDIAVALDVAVAYPQSAPFHPDLRYPELSQLPESQVDPENRIYRAVRDLLASLGYDADRFATAQWNPFGDIIRPGNRVVIKPNLVLHHNSGNPDISAVVTHSSVLRPVIDYCLIALRGAGELIVGDAPHGDADFEKIVRSNGLRSLVEWYQGRGQNVALRDFRKFVYPNGFSESVCERVDRDPDGYVMVDLGRQSHLCGLANLEGLYGSDYNRAQIVREHASGNHKYLVSATVLHADVVICVPKMKTHKKTGVTINLKNLVGINGDKNFLAHFRVGSPSQGGDEFPDSRSLVLSVLRAWDHWSTRVLLAPNTYPLRVVYRYARFPFRFVRRIYRLITGNPIWEKGNWHGNDTCWRMCLDLNHILRNVDAYGNLQSSPQRRYFCLVDGIVSGEGDGPMCPDPKPCGLLAAGKDPYQVDYISSYLMGFDPEKLALLRESRSSPEAGFDPNSLRIACSRRGAPVDYKSVNLRFRAHPAWKGTIERPARAL